ncbi:MAG TPA: hypothetical protein VHO69_16525, partial [Phototrophicaceae bacterium]|nr:hypothetical protein [Phototrophicaceae bacterium]
MQPIQLETRATAETRELPSQASLRHYLSQKRGTAEIEAFMGRVQAVYNGLYAQRPAFDNQQLRTHLENNILLGLALYRALQADGQSPADAYTETRDYLA